MIVEMKASIAAGSTRLIAKLSFKKRLKPISMSITVWGMPTNVEDNFEKEQGTAGLKSGRVL
jgi:hypothetical protein